MELDEARENLRLIRDMIEEGRRCARDNGLQWALWGAFAIVAALLGFALSSFDVLNIFPYAFAVAYFLCLGVSIFMGRRAAKERPKTFASRAYSALWAGTVAAMALIVAAYFLTDRLPLTTAMAFIAVVFGMSVFSSARLTGYAWLFAVALLWWCGAGAIFLTPLRVSAITFLALAVLGCIAPGCVLAYVGRKK